jgi:hypothetical protein
MLTRKRARGFDLIHGPISLFTVKSEKGNLIHLFGDEHNNSFNVNRNDFVMNVIKRETVECTIVYESNLKFFKPDDLFPSNFHLIHSDIRESGRLVLKFSSFKYFSEFHKFPERSKNSPKALQWVKLNRSIMINITNFDKLFQACRDLAVFIESFSPSRAGTKFTELEITTLVRILYDTFSNCQPSLRFWFLFTMGKCLEMHTKQATNLQERYRLQKKPGLFSSMAQHRVGAIFCDFVTLHQFAQLEISNMKYFFIYGYKHCEQLFDYFANFLFLETIQYYPTAKYDPNVKKRDVKHWNFLDIKPISKEFILI